VALLQELNTVKDYVNRYLVRFVTGEQQALNNKTQNTLFDVLPSHGHQYPELWFHGKTTHCVNTTVA
jgi:hypothetical protein